ncbi:hypothetical protein [Variovorax sp. PBL-H6]|uniref:hypothetical protein n=1 Tax=Variovorax sp. PBL-H6 TaxID=434009 RepID=UPI001E638C57|nr:hypothetical protein [Variovorax sp. PBL-H6]
MPKHRPFAFAHLAAEFVGKLVELRETSGITREAPEFGSGASGRSNGTRGRAADVLETVLGREPRNQLGVDHAAGDTALHDQVAVGDG